MCFQQEEKSVVCAQTQGNSFFFFFFVCRLVNRSLLESNCTEPKVHIPEMFMRWKTQLKCILLGVFILMWRWKFPWVWVDVFIIKKISSVLKKQNHISQWDWPIAVFCSAFKSFLIVSQLMLCEIWCCLGLKDWSSGRELCQINILCLCLFHSAFCVAAFKVVLGMLDQCFRLVGCLPQTRHHKNAYYCKAPFNKAIKKALCYLARKYV